MSFFKSEIVKNEMTEIAKMQQNIYYKIHTFHQMTNSEKLTYIEELENLLEKQRILYTRLSLSNDQDAKDLKNRLSDAAFLMGYARGSDVGLIFDSMKSTISALKDGLT